MCGRNDFENVEWGGISCPECDEDWKQSDAEVLVDGGHLEVMFKCPGCDKKFVGMITDWEEYVD